MVPPILQLPLGDTIGIIADSDFYQGWLNLVPVEARNDLANVEYYFPPGSCRFSHY